jgi:hypothetical protein
MEYTFDPNIISDLHKDAYGFRPSEGFWEDWMFSSDDEKQEIWDNLLTALQRSIDEEEEREVLAVGSFEGRIEDAMADGSTDRATAIRQIIGSVGLTDIELSYGGEYACFQLGLPYAYAKELDIIIKEMTHV